MDPRMMRIRKLKAFWALLLVVTTTLGFALKRCVLDEFIETHFASVIHTLSSNRSTQFHPRAALRLGLSLNVSGNVKPGPAWDKEAVPEEIHSIQNGKAVRVLVWVMTMSTNLPTKAAAIKETWGKRCDVIIFFSSKTDPSFPAIGFDMPEGRHHLTAKTMSAFRYIYQNHFDDADWFMKADDDTYVIVENLRHFLSDKDTSKPIYYGHLFKVNVQQGYYSGGSGYVISKEALHRFGTEAVGSHVCPEDGKDEDVDFGLCMERLGVVTSPSLDSRGRSLFHPLAPSVHFLGQFSPWIHRYSALPVRGGYGISSRAISFHYVTPDNMKLLDFYLYYLRPYRSGFEVKDARGESKSVAESQA